VARQRCLVIGHHAFLVEGLRYLLEPEFEVLTSVANLQAAVSTAAKFQPTAALIDLEPEGGALEIGRALRAMCPDVVLTYLTNDIDPCWDVNAISKTRSASDILGAVRGSMNGVAQHSATLDSRVKLSVRERQVLWLLVHGWSMKRVARVLDITPRTVAFHKYKAMRDNGLRSNSELILFAQRNGLLSSHLAQPSLERGTAGTARAWSPVDKRRQSNS
jgi:DNA-binding NarL/FixJ family response regulator